jgi:hypothetical protein
MYPSIKCKFVRRAIKNFAGDLNAETQGRIETCLEMIKFGMGNTLLTFVDKYYKYGGDLDIEDRGRTIGGYESAWLADLCMEYVMDNSRDNLALFMTVCTETTGLRYLKDRTRQAR